MDFGDIDWNIDWACFAADSSHTGANPIFMPPVEPQVLPKISTSPAQVVPTTSSMCTQCAHLLTNDSIFCSKCGAQRPKQTNSGAPQGVVANSPSPVASSEAKPPPEGSISTEVLQHSLLRSVLSGLPDSQVTGQKRKATDSPEAEKSKQQKVAWRKYGQKTLTGQDTGLLRCYYRCNREGCKVDRTGDRYAAAVLCVGL